MHKLVAFGFYTEHTASHNLVLRINSALVLVLVLACHVLVIVLLLGPLVLVLVILLVEHLIQF